ncbi:hypothetical protein ACKKBG_A32585 [Auxenochlorella protothecoides x Auxenochlorella symbiontica]
MSQFSFPLLSEREICHSLGELGMNVGPDHFSKPSYELVQPVYENLVSVLVGVSREELQQPVFAAIGNLEFPELHDESIPALAFITHLGKLLVASGIKDFSLRDLHKPDGQRLRRNLSAIINFAKFREEKLIAYAELQDHFQSLVMARDEAEGANADLHAALDELRRTAAHEQPDVERLTAAAEAVYSENAALNRQQAALSSEVKALKQGANALTDEAAGLRLRLASARGEEELLRGQVVQSPQKAAAALEALAAALERERDAVSEAERRQRDTAARTDAVHRVEKEVSKALALMEGAELEIGRKKEVSREVKRLRAELAAGEHEAAQLSATLDLLKRQTAVVEERVELLKGKCAVRKEAAEGNIEEQLRDKEAYEAENAANAAKLAENEATIRTLRERLREVRQAHEAQRAQVLTQYAGLLEEVRTYHGELTSAMEGRGPGRREVTEHTALLIR